MCRSSLLLLYCSLLPSFSHVVTIFNDRPRVDVNGSVVDCHDGALIYHEGTFFLYGEFYGNLTGRPFSPAPGWGSSPQLSVYTSPDLTAWTFKGNLFNSSVPSGVGFTKWIPTAVWSSACSCFILWFGSGGWAVATSKDGVHFDLVSNGGTSRLGGSTDGTGLLLDDDGQGYIAFSALSSGGPPPGGHLLSIERLTPDLLSSSKVNVSGFFPIDYVESPSLFKRAGKYYLLSPSCCCACRGGSGLVVYSANSILGPWVMQKGDINCNNTEVEMCVRCCSQLHRELALFPPPQRESSALFHPPPPPTPPKKTHTAAVPLVPEPLGRQTSCGRRSGGACPPFPCQGVGVRFF